MSVMIEARAYRTHERQDIPVGAVRYRVWAATRDGKRVRVVVAAPADLAGIKAAFYASTGLPADTPVTLFQLPEV